MGREKGGQAFGQRGGYSPGCSKRPQRAKSRGVPGYVEGLSDARTKGSERCILAHQGREGEKSDFFSILPAEER